MQWGKIFNANGVLIETTRPNSSLQQLDAWADAGQGREHRHRPAVLVFQETLAAICFIPACCCRRTIRERVVIIWKLDLNYNKQLHDNLINPNMKRENRLNRRIRNMKDGLASVGCNYVDFVWRFGLESWALVKLVIIS